MIDIDAELESKLRKEKVLGRSPKVLPGKQAADAVKEIRDRIITRRNQQRAAEGIPPVGNIKEHELPNWKGN